jgi:hypothetical protein
MSILAVVLVELQLLEWKELQTAKIINDMEKIFVAPWNDGSRTYNRIERSWQVGCTLLSPHSI